MFLQDCEFHLQTAGIDPLLEYFLKLCQYAKLQLRTILIVSPAVRGGYHNAPPRCSLTALRGQ